MHTYESQRASLESLTRLGRYLILASFLMKFWYAGFKPLSVLYIA